MAGFNDLPNELKLEIAQWLPKDAKKLFAHCSKTIYKLTFGLRFKGVILSDAGIKAFKDCGLYAGLRSTIKYVVPAVYWFNKVLLRERISDADYQSRRVCFRGPGDFGTVLNKTTLNLEGICDSIGSLPLFPNIRELVVIYSIPSSMEGNIFLALTEKLAGCKNLENLCLIVPQIKVVPGSYHVFHEALSQSAQDLLGPYLDQDAVWTRSMQMSTGMVLPNLKLVEIVHPSITSPLGDLDSPACKKAGFYYTVFAMAVTPKLTWLRVDTEAALETASKSSQTSSDNEGPLSRALRSKFSNITWLKTAQPIAPTNSDIDILAVRFPNLGDLEVRTMNGLGGLIPPHPYSGITGLRKLEFARLPWPTNMGRQVMQVKQLTDQVVRWKKAGMGCLKELCFKGRVRVEMEVEIHIWEPAEAWYKFFVDEKDGEQWVYWKLTGGHLLRKYRHFGIKFKLGDQGDDDSDDDDGGGNGGQDGYDGMLDDGVDFVLWGRRRLGDEDEDEDIDGDASDD
ncbi:hypothetical protein TWF481_008302 [Arthrobotrys musiformis]|uniref:F-box domain-containing protein n=1 Tax=Arthrobotrys musiformis TaxID=47236 RepID=A0AAV9W6V8_9PEZI